jgi:hypothetical protein
VFGGDEEVGQTGHYGGTVRIRTLASMSEAVWASDGMCWHGFMRHGCVYVCVCVKQVKRILSRSV